MKFKEKKKKCFKSFFFKSARVRRPKATKVNSRIFSLLLFTGILQLSALAVSAPRVSFRCVKSNSTSALILKVRNNGPDRLNQNTTVYYYYRTPASDMSITGSHRLDAPLDKGEVFSIEAGANPQTEITECGCALRPFIPVARTTRKASQ